MVELFFWDNYRVIYSEVKLCSLINH